MKKINHCNLTYAAFAALVPLAQRDKETGLGKVEPAELQMKECDIDKEADAMVLVDYGDITYQKGTFVSVCK